MIKQGDAITAYMDMASKLFTFTFTFTAVIPGGGRWVNLVLTPCAPQLCTSSPGQAHVDRKRHTTHAPQDSTS